MMKGVAMPKNNLNVFFTTIILTTLFVNVIVFAQKLVTFPGSMEIMSSPNKRYILHNVDPDKDSDRHKLILIDNVRKTKFEILSYDRSIDVLWAPDSNGLIINDFGGSDYADCIVFKLNKPKKGISIMELLKKSEINKENYRK